MKINPMEDKSSLRSLSWQINLGSKCMICNGAKKEELKCGQSFHIGKHYKFVFKDAIDNNAPSPGKLSVCLFSCSDLTKPLF